MRLKAVLTAAFALAAVGAKADGLDEPFRAGFDKALEGKTVAFLPVAMNFDLAQGWYAGLKKELEPWGVKVVVRDPNWSTTAGAQALTTLVSEKPAVIVVHNPDVQTYAKLLQRAEAAGTYVVQVNMGSAYRTTGFVGADWVQVGETDAEAVVAACNGKSNKIAIVQGALSAAASAYTLKGVENVLAKHPEVKVVSSQAADWDAAKAKAITQTVLQQNPDLVRHRRLLGRHGRRHGGGGEGGRAHRQGVRRHLGRRRAEGRLRAGQVRGLRSRRQLRRAHAGRQHGFAHQMAARQRLEGGQRQELQLHDAHSDHQGQCCHGRNLLEPRKADRRQISLGPGGDARPHSLNLAGHVRRSH